MLNPKLVDRAFKMLETISAKHEGEMRSLDFDWYVIETFDARYPDSLIQNVVPWLKIDFK